jgi:nicotinamidase-related amidase
MKHIILIGLVILQGMFISTIQAQRASESNPEVALIIVDIQNFYFSGGVSELVEPIPAAKNARLILDLFRTRGFPIVHVKHDFSPGGEIHDMVRPFENEKVITKKEVNCYLGTDLLDHLMKHQLKTLVLVGMQTHMCLEAAARASHDLGYKVIVLGDACATRDLKYDGIIIKADQVQASTLSTLKSYATVLNTDTFIQNFPY